ncbi:MAG: O-antigen ligase family protein [Vicinamibacterales bacterium]
METPAPSPLWSATRVVVVVSALAAAAGHALASGGSPLAALTALALLAGLAGGRLAPTVAPAAVGAIAPIWQVVAALAFGAPDIQHVMPWLAAMAGGLAGAAPTHWHLPRPWTAAVGGWALVVALTWPVTVARELDFTWLSIAGPGGESREVVLSVQLAAAAQLVALLAFDWLAGLDERARARLWRWLGPPLAASCGVALWQAVATPPPLSTALWSALRRSPGTFYDANALGAMAALVVTARAGLTAAAGRLGAARAVGWAGLSLAAVLASGSRTSLAGWLVVVGIGGPWALARRSRRTALAVTVGTLAIGALATSVWNRPDGFSAATRLLATGRALLDPAVARNALWNRDGYGPATSLITAEHPWAGIGPGAYGVVVTAYGTTAIGVPLPPDNAQNWWRHQVAELGLGALPAIVCSLLAAAAAWQAAVARRPVAAMTVVALGLMSWVSPPVQHPIVHVLVALVLADAAHPPLAGRQPGARRPAPAVAWGVLAWALAVGGAVGLAYEGWTSFRPPFRAARFQQLYYYGFAPEFQSERGPARWAATRAVGVFPPAAGALDIGVSLPHDDLATRPVRVRVGDRDGARCAWEIADAEVRTCRLPPPAAGWPMVQVEVSRPWRREGGVERAALVSATLAP